MRPPTLLWPDVEAWAVGYLMGALDDSTEPYAANVSVRADTGAIITTPLVTVRDDGGGRSDVSRTTSLAVNVWHADAEKCSDLARLVQTLLEASAGNGPVVACLNTFGPYRVPEQSTTPHRYLTADLVVTGTPPA